MPLTSEGGKMPEFLKIMLADPFAKALVSVLRKEFSSQANGVANRF